MLLASKSLETFNQFGMRFLPRLIGIEVLHVEPERIVGCSRSAGTAAPNGYLHGASVIALADTMAGYGALFNLPASSRGERCSSTPTAK